MICRLSPRLFESCIKRTFRAASLRITATSQQDPAASSFRGIHHTPGNMQVSDTSGNKDTLSTRGRQICDYGPLMMLRNGMYKKNMYDKKANPQGIVNMGMAENYLCEDLITEKMRSPGMLQWEPYMQYYFDYTGHAKLKSALVDLYNRKLHPHKPLQPEHLLLTSGAGCALDLLASFICDPGDHIVTLVPYYGRIDDDVGTRDQVTCIHLPLRTQIPDTGFPTYAGISEDIDKCIVHARAEGKHVKAICIINPLNPTGGIIALEEIQKVLQVAEKHDVHVIMDEIYALSIFDETSEFRSFLQLEHIPQRNKVHFVSSFSKDFGLSGVRVGIIHTTCPEIRSCAAKMLYFSAVPPVVSSLLANLVSDTEWLDTIYFPSNLKRMREAHSYCLGRLRDMGVKCAPTQAGFFIWADFTELLPEVTWDAELALFEAVWAEGVYLIPGSAMYHHQPGFLRVTVTLDRQKLDLGLERLGKVLKTRRSTAER